VAARTYDESDLRGMPDAELQWALLKVPDDLLVQALAAAADETRRALLANLSGRRGKEIAAESERLRASGTLTRRSARAALRTLVRSVFEVTGPERGGDADSAKVAPGRRARRAADRPDDGGRASAPDLSPGALDRLREARAIVSTFRGISAHARHLEHCRKGLAGALLLRRWMKRRPLPSRNAVYKAICKRPREPS
jgi:hypothetical protein